MKMKKIRIIVLAAGMVLSPYLLNAQTLTISGLNNDATPDSIVQIAAESQGLTQISPTDLPIVGGTYWWVMPGGFAVPAPCLPLDSSVVYQVADGQFLVDDTGGQIAVNTRQFGSQAQASSSTIASALAAQADAVVNLITQIQTTAANQQTRMMARAMGMDVPSLGDGGDSGGGGDYSPMYSGGTPIDTNALWLEITNVSNGWSYLNLHNATNQVYAIWSTTNLALPFASGQVEMELWPTGGQTNVLPFAVQNFDRQILFFRAEDWTGVDSDSDGIPDWWAWKYFGTVNVTATNLDNYFRPLLYDYQHGQNPDQMGFSQVLAWGDNSFGQCNVPSNLTNAVAVAGNGDAYLTITLEYTYIDGVLTLWPFVSATPTGVFSMALKADGGMVAWGDNAYGQTNIPSNLTNIVAIAAGSCHGLALDLNGNVHAWGSWDSAYEYGVNVITNSAVVPGGISNVVAIAAGRNHDVALRADGTVLAWGYFTNAAWVLVPTNLPPAKAVAAGWNYSAALLANGTVAVWAGSLSAPTNSSTWYVPASLTNAVAIAGGPFDLLVLTTDGSIIDLPGDSENDFAQITNAVSVANGYMPGLALDGSGNASILINSIASPNYPLSHMLAIAAGWNHALAIRGGLLTSLIVGQPASQFVATGTNLTLSVQTLDYSPPSYQWQFDGVNLTGATNAALTLANVQTYDTGSYCCVVANNFGAVVSSNALITVVTPPVITYQSQPTNIICEYGNYIGFSAVANAPGQTNGFPLSYRWQWNGTNIAGATTNNYSFTVNDTNGGTYTFIASNAAGTASATWLVTVTNAINVTNDLLLIYNTNSTGSAAVLNYYLAHRPGVSGANVLGIGCATNETILSADFTNQILTPYLNWLTNNPAKHPQYLVLFMDIPSIVQDSASSVQYQLYTATANGRPFVTSINMNGSGGTNDCIAYINKLATIGVLVSSNSPILSASANGYGNTNYVVDDVNNGYCGDPWVPATTNGLIAAGVTTGAIDFITGCETPTSFLPHITNAVNVSGYICWGWHSNWGTHLGDGAYPIDGDVQWSGNSSWWLIRTEESYNGQRSGQFLEWFASNAFGGSSYSNTPIGGPTYVEEPLAPATDNAILFGLWAEGKNLAICCWVARNPGTPPYLQVVGDPFVVR